MTQSETPLVTALVCTRNRGASVIGAVSSILANTHPNFELIIVDQSVNEETAQAVAPFMGDARLRYLHPEMTGVTKARNLGMAEARGEIIAITDDDCEAPAHWLETMAGIFAAHPTVAVAFCNVDPAPYDRTIGFIPAYQRTGSVLLSRLRDKCKARGIGAGMAVRRSLCQLR